MAWKDFRNTMKEKRSGGKRKIITDLKSYFTSLTENRFQESWEDTSKSSLQKNTHMLLKCSNADLASRVLIAYLHVFYSYGREKEEIGGKEYIIKKEVDCSKTKL